MENFLYNNENDVQPPLLQPFVLWDLGNDDLGRKHQVVAQLEHDPFRTIKKVVKILY